MLLSCKITHSCLRFLERQGADLEPLYERFDWPLHYLRDASSWLEADRLEFVLANLEELYGSRTQMGADPSSPAATEGFFELVGHQAAELRSWGALDSVLRIVPGVRDLYHQPDRFLASFISPAPQIGRLLRLDEKTEFRIDFSDERMPCTARYLRAVLEALPEFIGKPHASVQWSNGNISVEWSDRQTAFGRKTKKKGTDEPALERDEPSLSPDLLRTILIDLSTAQRDLETARRELKESKEREAALGLELLNRLKPSVVGDGLGDGVRDDMFEPTPAQQSSIDPKRVASALHEVNRLGDYFARAQQLVTLLRQSVRTTAGTQTADVLLKRTAWAHVVEEAPLAIAHVQALLSGEDPKVAIKFKNFKKSTRDLLVPKNTLSFFENDEFESASSSPSKSQTEKGAP